jgi:hypothetical protein
MLRSTHTLLSRGTMGQMAMLGRRLKKDVVRDFLNSSYRIWGTRFDYSIAEIKHPNVQVKIVCKQHGVFHVTPRDHLHKQKGCPSCSTAERVRKERTQSALPPSPDLGEIMQELAPGRKRIQKKLTGDGLPSDGSIKE